MSERGVCICPACGCQFSDHQKVKLERAAEKIWVSDMDGVATVCGEGEGVSWETSPGWTGLLRRLHARRWLRREASVTHSGNRGAA